MKGKDLTKIMSMDEVSKGDLTWFPRSNHHEEHRRGIIIEKGISSIIVNEHYTNYLGDPTVEKTLYFFNGGFNPKDTYDKITSSEEGARYRENASKLEKAGVKLR